MASDDVLQTVQRAHGLRSSGQTALVAASTPSGGPDDLDHSVGVIAHRVPHSLPLLPASGTPRWSGAIGGSTAGHFEHSRAAASAGFSPSSMPLPAIIRELLVVGITTFDQKGR